MSAPEGLLLLDKPAGITSHDLVDMVRRALGTRKVGHAGTLDPMATGLMLIGVGRATRLLRYLVGLDKAYEGTARLGEETDTLDAEGSVVRKAAVDVDGTAVSAAAAAMVGESLQKPPAFSAVKVGGRKLYEAARDDVALEAEPKPVRVDSFRATSFDGRDVGFEVECSSGTYVRVLASDLGAALGCGAHLVALRRTRIGPFMVQEATAVEDAAPSPVERMVDALPRRELTPAEAEDVSHGRPLGLWGREGAVAVFGPDGSLLAVYEDRDGAARAETVLAPAS